MHWACTPRCNQTAIRSRRGRKFSARNQQVPTSISRQLPSACNPLQKIQALVPFLACKSLHATFVLCRGIFSQFTLHHSSRLERWRSFLGRQIIERQIQGDSDISGAAFRVRAELSSKARCGSLRLKGRRDPAARLTCVSVRCLSSYLIFRQFQ